MAREIVILINRIRRRAGCPIAGCTQNTIHRTCRSNKYSSCSNLLDLVQGEQAEYIRKNFSATVIFRGVAREWRRFRDEGIYEIMLKRGVNPDSTICVSEGEGFLVFMDLTKKASREER